MWEMTAVFYTDSMSFGMGILGLAFLKLAAASRGKRRQTLWALLAAGMAVLAGTWKITVIIQLIACAVSVPAALGQFLRDHKGSI